MRRSILALCLLIALSWSAAADGGEVSTPGAVPSPTPPTNCTENCTNAAPAEIGTLSATELAIIQILVSLLRP